MKSYTLIGLTLLLLSGLVGYASYILVQITLSDQEEAVRIAEYNTSVCHNHLEEYYDSFQRINDRIIAEKHEITNPRRIMEDSSAAILKCPYYKLDTYCIGRECNQENNDITLTMRLIEIR